MDISSFFPIWNQLTPEEQKRLSESAVKRTAKKGTLLHNGESDCAGLFLIESGQLRSYILSEDGREVTLYRLFEYDICLFSASCMMQSLMFDITIEAEKDSSFWVVPPEVYKEIMAFSAPLANYTNDIMATHFSEAMWLIEQVLWKSLDRRLAAFLLEEANIEETLILKMTHEQIANHLGTAREVITRMLKYFQGEGLVSLSRGTIKITSRKQLQELSEE